MGAAAVEAFWGGPVLGAPGGCWGRLGAPGGSLGVLGQLGAWGSWKDRRGRWGSWGAVGRTAKAAGAVGGQLEGPPRPLGQLGGMGGDGKGGDGKLPVGLSIWDILCVWWRGQDWQQENIRELILRCHVGSGVLAGFRIRACAMFQLSMFQGPVDFMEAGGEL